MLGRFGRGQVLLKPAPAGKGVIAGGPVRAVIQAVGIPNVLTKSIGSHNPHNVVKATINALEQLRDQNAVAEMRGVARRTSSVRQGRSRWHDRYNQDQTGEEPDLHAGEAQDDRAQPRSEER